MIKKSSFQLVILTSIFLSAQSFADYSNHIDAKIFAEKMISEHKFSREEIVGWLKKAKQKDAIIKAMSRPAEKVKPWYLYKEIFITDSRIKNGVRFWSENIDELTKAYNQFGVDPEIIVSIIGIETNYGSNTGDFRVIDALCTLAFDFYTQYENRESRRKFFTIQLENLFILAREQNIDPLSLKGSYAGAMGLGQFMPNSYRDYAVDFDGDSFADIWLNPADAIGSVANYLMAHGWEKDQGIITEGRLLTENSLVSFNRISRPKNSLAYFKNLGLDTLNPTDTSKKVLPIKLEEKSKKEYWFGFNNFYVIGRYNPRVKYAMAVTQLSDKIKTRFCQGYSC